MATKLTPWHVFFKSLRRQKAETVQNWLRRWVFTDDGAALIPGRGNHTAKSSSLEEKERITAQLFAVKRKWPETFH